MEKELPGFLYGTAWKEDKTRELVQLALKSGFREIDTANQRKHYYEEGVGEGLKYAYKNLSLSREELFLQTKFTYQTGQDHRLPYDAEADFYVQVKQSFESSLKHLDTDYLDSYVLHGPYYQDVISDIDIAVWQSMERLVQKGLVHYLGVSNITYEQLKTLCSKSKVAPKFVQNRCFAHQAWDAKIRGYCIDNDLVYQGFSLLTANQPFLISSEVHDISKRYGKTKEQIIFKFAQQIGILPLTGTTSKEHMNEDLFLSDFELQPNELDVIENIAI